MKKFKVLIYVLLLLVALLVLALTGCGPKSPELVVDSVEYVDDVDDNNSDTSTENSVDINAHNKEYKDDYEGKSEVWKQGYEKGYYLSRDGETSEGRTIYFDERTFLGGSDASTVKYALEKRIDYKVVIPGDASWQKQRITDPAKKIEYENAFWEGVEDGNLDRENNPKFIEAILNTERRNEEYEERNRLKNELGVE